MIEAYLACLDLAYFEVTEAFKGLADEHVWKRPAEGLLSVGELAGHVAHWEAVRLAGEGGQPWPDLAKCRVSSPLIDRIIEIRRREADGRRSDAEGCAHRLRVLLPT